MQATSTARPFTTKKEFYAQFKKKSIAHELWLRFLKNKTAVAGLIIFCIIVAVAITAPWITNYDTVVIKMNIAERLQPPSMNHWIGTDELGRDILARIVYGARVSLLIGISAIFVSLMIGLVLGGAAGYYGGKTDSVIMRAMDVFLCLPDVLLALAIVAAFGNTKLNLVIAIGLAFSPKFSRVVRSAVMGVRDNEYIEAARIDRRAGQAHHRPPRAAQLYRPHHRAGHTVRCQRHPDHRRLELHRAGHPAPDPGVGQHACLGAHLHARFSAYCGGARPGHLFHDPGAQSPG